MKLLEGIENQLPAWLQSLIRAKVIGIISSNEIEERKNPFPHTIKIDVKKGETYYLTLKFKEEDVENVDSISFLIDWVGDMEDDSVSTTQVIDVEDLKSGKRIQLTPPNIGGFRNWGISEIKISKLIKKGE